jgi:hypothetical protein
MTIATPNNTAKYSCGHCLAPSSRCQAHLASRRSPPATAHTPKTRLSATNARAKGPDGGTGLSKATSNGGVERPPRSASSPTRAHNFSQRSRRAPRRLSRTAPTIVRGRHKPAYCARAEVSWQRNEGTAQRWDPQGRFRLPARALRQAKGLRLQLPALHDFLDESWLRPLTVKLRGRPEELIKRRGRTLSSRARGA